MLNLVEPSISKNFIIFNKINFKYLFGNQKNIRFTEYLLEALLNKDPGYYHNKITILNSFSKQEDCYENIDMDIRINLDNKEVIILSVYNKFSNLARIRSLMYLAFSLATHLNKCTDIRKVKKHTQFNIIRGSVFRHQEFGLLNKDKLKDSFISNILTIHLINIDKYGSKNYRGNKKLCSIFDFLRANSKEEAVKTARKGDKILMEMWQELESFWMDKWYENYINNKNYEEMWHDTELKEYIMKTKIDIARNMLKIGMDPKTIILATGIEKNDILKLKEE